MFTLALHSMLQTGSWYGSWGRHSGYSQRPCNIHFFPAGGWGGNPIYKWRGCLTYLTRVKNAIWYLLGCLASKSPQRELLRNMKGDNVLSNNWYLLGEKKISNHACKTGSWCLLGALSKIPTSTPVFVIWEFPWDLPLPINLPLWLIVWPDWRS